MTLPDVLLLHRFRSFDQPEALPLRPITLVMGANNAGKSAVLRAIATMGASLVPRVGAPLAVPPADPRTLAWQGRAELYDWQLGLRWSEGTVREVRWTLDASSTRDLYVRQIDVRRADGPPLVAREEASGRLVLQGAESEVTLDGLMPTSDPLRDVAEALRPLVDSVCWLSGVRARVTEQVPRRGRARLESDGAGAAQLLARDPLLVDSVNAFYAKLLPPRLLEVRSQPPSGHRLTLNPAAAPSFDIAFDATGEGMSQVLPVLVQAALTAREGGILAVEEPESHLHSDAQQALAEHLCALVAAHRSTVRFVIETHSRVFLLGTQLAVAKGELSPDDVSVLWVDQEATGQSRVAAVGLDAQGRLDARWPPSALRQDVSLARALHRLGREAEP